MNAEDSVQGNRFDVVFKAKILAKWSKFVDAPEYESSDDFHKKAFAYNTKAGSACSDPAFSIYFLDIS